MSDWAIFAVVVLIPLYHGFKVWVNRNRFRVTLADDDRDDSVEGPDAEAVLKLVNAVRARK